MFKISFPILLALLLASNGNCDWSWGSNKKLEATLEAETDDIVPEPLPLSSSFEKSQAIPRSASLPQIPQAVLPLEQDLGDYAALEAAQSTQEDVGDEGRSGRFLGIPGRLCKLGVKGLCDKGNDGYPPLPPSNYGNNIPSASYNTYTPNVYPPLSGYPSLNAVAPKPSKGLFGGLFKNKKKDTVHSTFIPPPSYGAPKPTYGAPKPTYGAPKPTYGAPQPIYNPPTTNFAPKPVYQPPIPSYSPPKPKPNYHSVQKISYKQPIHTFDTPKPKDVIIHQIKGQHSFPKHVISQGIHPTKVQHVHTHTHIYKANPGFDIRDNYNHPRDDGSYQSASQIKSVKASVHNVVPFSSVNDHKIFLPQAQEKSIINSPFKPSQQVPFASLLSNQGKRHISPTTNAFNSFGEKTNQQSTNAFNSFGEKTNQQSTNAFNSFGENTNQQSTNAFNSFGEKTNQQSKNAFNSFGEKPNQQSFQSSIDKLAASFAKNGLQGEYPEDCQCVPRQYCALEDLIARTDNNEIRHLLDARNEPSEVLSNGTFPEDYYEYDYLHSDYNSTYDDEIEFTTIVSDTALEESETTVGDLSTDASITTTTTTTEKSRVRREAEQANKNSTDEELQGRQLTGFTPGLNGCGPDYVCCRRPVYIAAKRSSPVCGKGNPSIHGRVASFEYEKGQSDFGEYPWQAAILRDEGPESMFVCGATLIDDQHVLTAAHCVIDLKVEVLKVRLGEWDVNRDTEFYNYVEERVSGVFIHPEFYKGNLYNDIAVLRLAKYIDIDSHPHISPVCLPPPNTDFANYRCSVTGWGKDAFGDNGKFQHILKELEIPVVDHKTCELALKSTRLGRDYKLHRGFLCAGGEEGKDACKGDGGGPLVCATSSKTFQLAGIVSWGIGCGQRGIPGVYVNIPYYVDWIRSTTTI